MDKSVLPLLMLSFISVVTLKLVFEITEHALRVARGRGVDQIFHWIRQDMVLYSRTRKSTAAHPCDRAIDVNVLTSQVVFTPTVFSPGKTSTDYSRIHKPSGREKALGSTEVLNSV